MSATSPAALAAAASNNNNDPNLPVTVKVAIRCRPLIPKEINEGCQPCVDFLSDQPQVILGNDKTFTYDSTFPPEAPQLDVFETVVPLIENLFKGYNATVLAYGQTGSGKTYTMGTGVTNTEEIDNSTGITPRVAKMIFEMIQDKSDEDTSYVVKVSFLEIYREAVVDLLAANKENLAVRENPDGGIMVAGLSEVLVETAEDTLFKLNNGSKSRAVGATAMNAGSSRSHAIFTIVLEQRKRMEDGDEEICYAKFHLVDLAGSERASKTKAEGKRLQEGININKGLLALGNVISALVDEKSRRKDTHHIPYRDSKLTRILQDSLGGNSHTMMIACVSPADSNMEETLSTLRYADRAKRIKNKPMVNRDARHLEMLRLRTENQSLRLQLAQYEGSAADLVPLLPAPGSSGGAVLPSGEESEKFRVLKVENEKKVNKLIAKDRKKQAEIVRLERKNELQENKLKRKMEEASAAQKRLKEALERQKAAQDTRNERTITGASEERIRKWLLQEIEIKTSTEECKQHVQSMTEERKLLVRRQRALDSQLAEPPNKIRLTTPWSHRINRAAAVRRSHHTRCVVYKLDSIVTMLTAI